MAIGGLVGPNAQGGLQGGDLRLRTYRALPRNEEKQGKMTWTRERAGQTKTRLKNNQPYAERHSGRSLGGKVVT